MYLSVSIDHRIVDGATGARWMNVVKDCLENPQRLLLGGVGVAVFLITGLAAILESRQSAVKSVSQTLLVVSEKDKW